mmetsp:Transcript_48651/g.96329  ORF Transcript_48651/g.96329 Transcript_48651/m.96329 type:complete len:246 (+) Transcript_48651:237-974(+)
MALLPPAVMFVVLSLMGICVLAAAVGWFLGWSDPTAPMAMGGAPPVFSPVAIVELKSGNVSRGGSGTSDRTSDRASDRASDRTTVPSSASDPSMFERGLSLDEWEGTSAGSEEGDGDGSMDAVPRSISPGNSLSTMASTTSSTRNSPSPSQAPELQRMFAMGTDLEYPVPTPLVMGTGHGCFEENGVSSKTRAPLVKGRSIGTSLDDMPAEISRTRRLTKESSRKEAAAAAAAEHNGEDDQDFPL